MKFDLFLERFLSNVEAHGNKELFTFVDDNGSKVCVYTYKEFGDLTATIAQNLLDRKDVEKGNRILLVFPPSLDFIASFVACLRAGIVAVPVYPPHPGRRKDISHFISIQSSCKAKVVLTNSSYNHAKKLTSIKNFFSNNRGINKSWPNLTWIVTSNLKSSAGSKNEIDKSDPSEVAFIQYTSGSTSAPKGVMLSHNNISHNLSVIMMALQADENVKVVSWLPQYHDMGLIGAYLGVLYCGGSGVYMSPFSFIKNPVLWLELISKHKATHVQSPNFAFKLTLRKFLSAPKKIDLSSLKHMFNAAEPIEVEALNDFKSDFSKHGLAENVISPGYGLAEHSVYVCDGGTFALRVDKKILEKERIVKEISTSNSTEQVTTLQSCGNPHRFTESGIQIRIVNEDTKTIFDEEDRVGEIWITSASKASGYFGDEEKTADLLQAKVSVTDAKDKELKDLEWIRTGDLGFFHQRELFICGRIKDLIIIRGRNHFAQDVELSVECHHNSSKHIRPGCSAAFSIPHPGTKDEVLVVVAEIRDSSAKNKSLDLNEIVTDIRQAVLKENEVKVFAVTLIKQGAIVKTTSGKIKRHGNREMFMASGSHPNELLRVVENSSNVQQQDIDIDKEAVEERILPVPGQSSKSEIELLVELKDEVARLMARDVADINTDTSSLVELGMDSVDLSQLKGIMIRNYGIEVHEQQLFAQQMTLKHLAKVLFHKLNGLHIEDLDPTQSGSNAAPQVAPKPKEDNCLCC